MLKVHFRRPRVDSRRRAAEEADALTRLQIAVVLIIAGVAAAFLGDPHTWRLALALPLFAAGVVAALSSLRA